MKKTKELQIVSKNQDEGDHHRLITGHHGGHDSLFNAYNVLSENVNEILLQFSGSNKSNGK